MLTNDAEFHKLSWKAPLLLKWQIANTTTKTWMTTRTNLSTMRSHWTPSFRMCLTWTSCKMSSTKLSRSISRPCNKMIRTLSRTGEQTYTVFSRFTSLYWDWMREICWKCCCLITIGAQLLARWSSTLRFLCRSLAWSPSWTEKVSAPFTNNILSRKSIVSSRTQVLRNAPPYSLAKHNSETSWRLRSSLGRLSLSQTHWYAMRFISRTGCSIWKTQQWHGL
jgi:hypothetical protein